MNAALQLGTAALSGGFIQWAAKPLWRWLRSGESEMNCQQHVAALRSALDKAGIRYTGVVGACDALTLAYEITKGALADAAVEMPPTAARAAEIASQKLSEAVKALEGSSRA